MAITPEQARLHDCRRKLEGIIASACDAFQNDTGLEVVLIGVSQPNRALGMRVTHVVEVVAQLP